jgi:class 3 adenylate cyclase/tetratricopeptide (TPR) repeat protein
MDRRVAGGSAGGPGSVTEPTSNPAPESSGRPAKRSPVTVLFTDLCGYTALSDALDPEDLHEIMTQIFGGIARIVAKYEGHIDKLLGDAALVLFGVPHAHEDDAVRAIKAALEIHVFVEQRSDRLRSTSGRDLRMHSSVSTGVVLTSDVDHTVGDTAIGHALSLASRLMQFAGPGDVVCTNATYAQAQGYFEFEDLGMKSIKGHECPVSVHRVCAARTLPTTEHRVRGLRAEIIGRREELGRLHDAVHHLQHGEAGLVAVRGDAGTGKSRLLDEFRALPEIGALRWLQMSARPYSQNVPYHPFEELLRREWKIGNGDLPADVRRKIETAVAAYPDPPSHYAPYVGALFGLDEPSLSAVDSESWKSHFFAFARHMLDSMALSGPTIVYMEDLHWADPSSLELLRFLVRTSRTPVLFITTYRPPFSLFVGEVPSEVRFREINLSVLSPSEADDMLASMLDVEKCPASVRSLVLEKAEGNPFYLEELVNSLVEQGNLVQHDGTWSISQDVHATDVPLSVLGVIAARLDHLDRSVRTVLLEASVIGRSFMVDLLARVTTQTDYASCLSELQTLDLVNVRSIDPRIEYEFKHALIQEVAYASLLKPERLELHEHVACETESMHADRLPEFYECLALHFSRGISTDKAIHYLIKSARKSFQRYAVEESHEFYRQAYEILLGMERTPAQDRQLLELVNEWAYVIYDRGDMADLQALLEIHRDLAESLGDSPEHAMWRVCYAIALHCRERFGDAVEHERIALEMADALGDEYVAGCARVWLAYSLTELGELDEAIMHSEKAIQALQHDPVYITEAYSALAFAYWTKGYAGRTFEIGERLFEIARAGPSNRALAAGHWVTGEGHLSDGDFEAAAESFSASIKASPEPWPSYHPRVYLAIAYIQLGRFDDARPYLNEVIELSETHGSELTLTPAIGLLGVATFASGDMSKGMELLGEAKQVWAGHEALLRLAALEGILGSLYLNMVSSPGGVSLPVLIKNLGFIARNILTSADASEGHFREALRIYEQMGATGSCGESYIGLTRLYAATKRKDEARECALKAVDCFERAGVETYLREARNLLDSLD